MGRIYSAAEREHGLAALAACDGSPARAARQTGIPESTLRRWARAQTAAPPAADGDPLRATLAQVRQQLAVDALLLAQAVAAQIEGAPLNQLATALGTVIDRCLKVDEHLAGSVDEEHKGVIRIEYVYPDGSIHSSAPWATDDPEQPGALSCDRLRAALWQDGDGEDSAAGTGAAWGEVLVAGADLRDGESGVARPEDDAGRCALAGD